MKSNYEMMEEIETLVELYIEKFQSRFPELDFKKIPIKYNLKGKAAGVFRYSYLGKAISLDFNLLIAKDNYEAFLERTVPHEVAHFCALVWKGVECTRSGRCIGHGDTWKRIMRFFEFDSTRCHSYDMSSVIKASKKNHYTYKCNCNTHELSSIRHNRILKGSKYTCNKCHSVLLKA